MLVICFVSLMSAIPWFHCWVTSYETGHLYDLWSAVGYRGKPLGDTSGLENLACVSWEPWIACAWWMSVMSFPYLPLCTLMIVVCFLLLCALGVIAYEYFRCCFWIATYVFFLRDCVNLIDVRKMPCILNACYTMNPTVESRAMRLAIFIIREVW